MPMSLKYYSFAWKINVLPYNVWFRIFYYFTEWFDCDNKLIINRWKPTLKLNKRDVYYMLRCLMFLRVEKYLLSPRILIIKRASNKARRRRTPTQNFTHAHKRTKKIFTKFYMKGSSLWSVKCFHRPNQFCVSLHTIYKEKFLLSKFSVSIW